MIPCGDPHLNFLKTRNPTRNRDSTRLIEPINQLRLFQQLSEQWVIKVHQRHHNPPREPPDGLSEQHSSTKMHSDPYSVGSCYYPKSSRHRIISWLHGLDTVLMSGFRWSDLWFGSCIDVYSFEFFCIESIWRSWQICVRFWNLWLSPCMFSTD